ncbi:UNVERIFIED_CONTAM: hypothetical protein Sradi_3160000 [Sesamum radiatum]|uniref:Uncharacterized protein n=1 Tax=Sesamum radiatum TaxID=300843 RepID=A0AAW2RED9_SESRA
MNSSISPSPVLNSATGIFPPPPKPPDAFPSLNQPATTPIANPTMISSPYKEKLLNTPSHFYFPTWLQSCHNSQDAHPRTLEEGTANLPSISFFMDELNKYHHHWRRTLIVKTYGLKYYVADLVPRFPNLPIEYYDKDPLFQMGQKLGRPIKIDEHTYKQSKGRFARLCIEVDTANPLSTAILIDNLDNL